MRARVADQLRGDVAPTKGEAWLWLQHARNRGLDAIQRRLRPEGDSSSSRAQQVGIDVAKPEGSHPRLPASRDLRGSVDPWRHRSQPSIPKQPVERASKLRMIPSGDEAAAGLYQSIDLHMCIHAQRMRTKQPNRLVRAGSVDGGGHEQDLVDREPWKYIASAAKSPRFGPSRSTAMRFQGSLTGPLHSQVWLPAPGSPGRVRQVESWPTQQRFVPVG
jgi:hypothetical protein